MLDPAGPGFLFHRNNEDREECCHHSSNHGFNDFYEDEDNVEVLPKVSEGISDDIWFNLIKIYQDRPNVRQKIIEAFLEANK